MVFPTPSQEFACIRYPFLVGVLNCILRFQKQGKQQRKHGCSKSQTKTEGNDQRISPYQGVVPIHNTRPYRNRQSNYHSRALLTKENLWGHCLDGQDLGGCVLRQWTQGKDNGMPYNRLRRSGESNREDPVRELKISCASTLKE